MNLTMNIVDMKQAQVMGQIQIRVARKMLDMQEMQGASAVALIDAARKVATAPGDALVAAATGLGGQLDTYG